MQCDFWKRKLITSIPTNPTWRPELLFCRRPVFAMFPIIIFCLLQPHLQVASFSHIASWGFGEVCNQRNWCRVRTDHLGTPSPWNRSQLLSDKRATQPPSWKPSQTLLLASETCWAWWALNCNHPLIEVSQAHIFMTHTHHNKPITQPIPVTPF